MTKSDPLSNYLPRVQKYLKEYQWNREFSPDWRKFRVKPLAQGEYNLNYLLCSPARSFVFRVNMGTQIDRDDQILYEYKTLLLLSRSGVTPQPYHVDDSRQLIDRGILIMEYLPGSPLDYRQDLSGAATAFAAIHGVEVRGEKNHLIVEEKPLSLIFAECSRLLEHYFSSELAQPEITAYLRKLLAKLADQKAKESYFQKDPWFAIVNTEVNSGNFIVNRKKGTTHLVDWEMPRWGDPSSDLCHFLSPLTTLWKTNYRFSHEAAGFFIRSYKDRIGPREQLNTLEDRLALKFPFVYLRGISWSAMGWVAYQKDYQGIRNRDTWRKLQQYMDLEFIASLFDPYLNNEL